jgi:2-polyprenyl-6-methoxyphenol hydroxylase-like FAD-dependent oxidoreductase
MTDTDGTVHPWTNQHPSKEMIENLKLYAHKVLPRQFAELVDLTEKPFIQAITDVLSGHSVFHDGRLVLMGDAVAGFRPHTAGSTSQAAFHALKLNEYLEGNNGEDVDWEGYENEVQKYAKRGVQHGIELGDRSQFQKHRMSLPIDLIIAMSGGPMADSS